MGNKENEMYLEDFPVCLVEFLNDDDLTVVSANSNFYNIIGYSKEEFQKEKDNSFKKVIHKSDLNKFQKQFLSFESGETGYFDLNLQLKNGNLNNIKINGTTLNKNGIKSYKCVIMCMGSSFNDTYEEIFQWECYRFVANISDDIIFRYNLEKDFIEFGRKYYEVFGRKTIIENFKRNLDLIDSIYTEDAKKLLLTFKEAIEDEKRKEVEIRIRNRDGKFEWFSLVYKIIIDNNEKYAIGRLCNINKQKTEKSQLIEKSQIDGLTKLYNKPATERMVEEILDSNYGSSIYALMVIDVDNFKGVNDTYGHLLGDAVLIDVSKIFKSIYRDTDIIGRIGGDEFLVFMNKVNSEEVVREKAELMCQKIRALYENEVALSKVSISVGIALANNERILYKDLFKNADLALYETKQKGKDGYTIFDENSYYDESIHGENSVRGITAYIKKKAMTILENEKNCKKAIEKVIDALGTKFNPSTVYIYTFGNDRQFAYECFQWCNKGIDEIAEGMKEIPLEAGVSDVNYLSYFNREDIFYCTDVQKLDYPFNEYMKFLGSKSILECLIYNDDGKVIGYIGFAEYTSQRLWIQSEVDALNMVAGILGKYLAEYTRQNNL